QFLESVLDNVPVCVAVKNIEDGRYIFANRAFERFSRFSRDHIVGKRADEIFRPDTAVGIDAADRAAVESPTGQYQTELVVERGSHKRVLSSNRVIARNEKNQPEFLIAMFDDVTAADILQPREAKQISSRDGAAIKIRDLLTEEHPILTRDGLRLFLIRRM